MLGRLCRVATVRVGLLCAGFNQRAEQLEGSGGRSELLAHDFGGAAAVSGRRRVGQAIVNEGQKMSRAGHDHGSVARQQGRHDVAEIARVRAEGNRRAIRGRLNHVLPAAVAQAAADEGDVGRSPPCAEFADDIDEQHARRRGGRKRGRRGEREKGRLQLSPFLPFSLSPLLQLCSSLPRNARSVQHPRDCLEPLGMPRHDDQPQLRPIGTESSKDVQRDRLLRLLRAAGQENYVIACDPRQLHESAGSRVVAIHLCAVVFHRAGDVDRFRPRAEGAEALGAESRPAQPTGRRAKAFWQ